MLPAVSYCTTDKSPCLGAFAQNHRVAFVPSCVQRLDDRAVSAAKKPAFDAGFSGYQLIVRVAAVGRGYARGPLSEAEGVSSSALGSTSSDPEFSLEASPAEPDSLLGSLTSVFLTDWRGSSSAGRASP